MPACSWRWIVVCAAPATLLLAAAGGLAGCGRGAQADVQTESEPPELPVVAAEVLEVQPTAWPAVVRTQGSLIADEVVIVGAKTAGRVAEVNVDLGDSVAAGATLAALDQEDFRLQVSLAEAQLVQARAALGLSPDDPLEKLDPQRAPPVREARAVLDDARTKVERLRQLRARNAVTQEEIDTAIAAEGVADARLASALNAVREKIAIISVQTAELNVAQQRLADAIVYAPLDGLVHERHVSRGSFVQIGDPLVTLMRTSTLRFRGSIPERHAQRLALGQQVTLSIEGVAEPLSANVTRISPAVEEASRSLVFEAAVDNSEGELRTGLFAEAQVVVDPAAVSLVIPPAALVEFAGAEKVWKVVDGVAQEQPVQTARRDERGIEISQGLVPGDVILAAAAQGRVARIEPRASASSPPPAAAAVEEPAAEEAGGER